MESNLHNRDFERFVKQNADQYRMFPSERVWKGVHSALHTRRRWYGIALVLLLISTAVVTWVMLIPGNKNETIVVSSIKDLPAIAPTVPQKEPLSTEAVPGPASNALLRKQADTKIEATVFSSSAFTSTISDNVDLPEKPIIANNNDEPAITTEPIQQNPKTIKNDGQHKVTTADTKQTNAFPIAIAAAPSVPAFSENKKTSNLPDLNKEKNKTAEEATDNKLPLIPERSAKDIVKISSKKKLNWQLYVTPTISYRTLAENTAFIAAARYNNYVNATGGGIYSTDVNTVVNHKPDIGFQVGVRSAYPLSKWISLTGGFQLSVSKYDIRAYQHPAEAATIALTDRSISTVSNFRNTNGYNENWLRNFYFSASVPVGLELKLSDGDKNYFGIASTLQPTYVLDNRAYLISADYKNYAEVPSLTRRWNMNASFEMFSSHTTGKLKWRVGPQIRYQTMSSFAKNYPIKEHLFDFGLKLGIQLK